MDWVHKSSATKDCRKKVVRFKFPNELEREWEGHGFTPVGKIFSHLKANMIIGKGYLYNLVRVNDLYQEVPSINSMLVVNEFQISFRRINQESLLNIRLTFVLI